MLSEREEGGRERHREGGRERERERERETLIRNVAFHRCPDQGSNLRPFAVWYGAIPARAKVLS